MTEKNDVSVRKQSLLTVLYEEVVRGSSVGEDDNNYLIKEQRIITFLSIPWELEKVLYLGYLVCLDAFLFLFTFLPIRNVCAVIKGVNWLVRRCLFLPTPTIDKGNICDLFRLSIILTCLLCMSSVNISMLYHLIRGQSVIKLYFIYNVLEIVDYLCLSFGSDVMEALFWLTIRNKRRKREHLSVIWHWVLACIYTIIHTMCYLIQAICLSVAINSHNKSLLVVMTSNQYMELKSYLFKKFDKENNYQIVARDIRERFSYTIILGLVCLRNMSQLDWDVSHMWLVLPDVALIMFSEISIDWLKHAFVTKFNGIPIESYRDYRYQLYDDLLNPKLYSHTFSNRMDLMARKILFIPIPLACLTVTVLIEVMPDDLQLDRWDYLKYGSIVIATLFVVKVINMGLIIQCSEQLRRESPVYTTPRVPPIKNVNSSVKLPQMSPSSVPVTPEFNERLSDPITTLSTISSSNYSERELTEEETVSNTGSSQGVDMTPFTSSSSAPNLPLSPFHQPLLSPSPPFNQELLSPSPEVQFLVSGSSVENTPPISPVTQPGSPAPGSLGSPVPGDRLPNSPDRENEPPLDNARNVNLNDNNNVEGLRKRTIPSTDLEE